jgi:hypothetical protein
MSVIGILVNDSGYHVTGNLPPAIIAEAFRTHTWKKFRNGSAVKNAVQKRKCSARITWVVVSEEDVSYGGAAGFAGVANPKNRGDLVAGLGKRDVEWATGHDDEDARAAGRVRDRGHELRLLAREEEARPVEALALDGLVGADDQHGHVGAGRGLRGGVELEAVPAARDVGAAWLVHGGDVRAQSLQRRRVLARRACTSSATGVSQGSNSVL